MNKTPGAPKVQFCPKGHDTYIYGRSKSGGCHMCHLVAQKRWRQGHGEQIKLISRKSDLKQYGLTLDSYTEMLQKQDSRCAICKEQKTLVIDHCHKTGKVRGLLCIGCNTGLGRYELMKEQCELYLGVNSNSTASL